MYWYDFLNLTTKSIGRKVPQNIEMENPEIIAAAHNNRRLTIGFIVNMDYHCSRGLDCTQDSLSNDAFEAIQGHMIE